MDDELSQTKDMLFHFCLLALKLDHMNSKEGNIPNVDRELLYSKLVENGVPVSKWPQQIRDAMDE